MFRIGQEEIDAVAKVITTKSMFKINNGEQASKQVETKLQTLLNTRYPIFMSSGHAALVSALTAMGIGPGDEVIVPAYTYIATAMAVVAAGAIPIIAEVDETLTISPADIEKKLSPRTRAIIPVHIQGFPCNMDAIMAIAKKHGLLVLEDACQAVGGSYKGRKLGTVGNAGALSFNFYKIISSGEGGALLTDDRTLFERALIYHDSSAIAFFGKQMQDFSATEFCGNEYRANELCAAVLNVQCDRLEGLIADLRRTKNYVMDALKGLCTFAPSNDLDGDCGTTIAIQFDSEEKARKFATSEGVHGGLPIDTGKHVYRNWKAIMEKRGACHPLMDPFKMEANKDFVPDYHENMCPETLRILSQVVYVGVSPDAANEELDMRIDAFKKALAAL